MMKDEQVPSRSRRSSPNIPSYTDYPEMPLTSHIAQLSSPPKVLSTRIFKDGLNRRARPISTQSSAHFDMLDFSSIGDPQRTSEKQRIHRSISEKHDQNQTFTAMPRRRHNCRHQSQERSRSRAELTSQTRSSNKRRSVSRLLKSVPDWRRDLRQVLNHVAEHMNHCSSFRERLRRKRIPLVEAMHRQM